MSKKLNINEVLKLETGTKVKSYFWDRDHIFIVDKDVDLRVDNLNSISTYYTLSFILSLEFEIIEKKFSEMALKEKTEFISNEYSRFCQSQTACVKCKYNNVDCKTGFTLEFMEGLNNDN